MADGSAHHGSMDDHGASVAAWFGVLALIVSSAVIGAGIYTNVDVVTIIGVVIGVVGLIIAAVLAKLGFGVAAKRREIAERRAAGEHIASHG